MSFGFPNQCRAIETEGVRCVCPIPVVSFHRRLKDYRLNVLKHGGQIHWQLHSDAYFIKRCTFF